MLGEGLTDSDSSTLDDLLAGFELPDQQNPEALQPMVLLPSAPNSRSTNVYLS